MILEKKPTSEIRKLAQKKGMSFLRESALDRVRRGLTTLKEINKVTFIEASARACSPTLPTASFRPEANALRPRLACEITSAGVVAARPGEVEHQIVSAFAPLRPGVLAAGLQTPNFTDRAAVAGAVRQSLDEISVKETKITVVIPDAAVRVLLLDFDQLPSKTSEALPIIRFRLRKLVPFEVEDAAVSYQIMPGKAGAGAGDCRCFPGRSPGGIRKCGARSRL